MIAPGADAGGCWSGCVVIDGRIPTAVYTGVESLGDGAGEPPEHRHPAALGCLLAVVVPVVDPVAVAVHDAAGRGCPDRLVLGAATAEAHRELGRRVLARLRRTR